MDREGVAADGEGLSVSKRRITLSTSGVVPEIERWGREAGTMLAISLHATRDDLITVHESALSNGTGGGVNTVSGNLLTNDPGATSITSVGGVTDGSANDLDARAGYIGVQQVVEEIVAQ